MPTSLQELQETSCRNRTELYNKKQATQGSTNFKGINKEWPKTKSVKVENSNEGTYSNRNLAANNPGLPAPNHSKFHLPSRNGDLHNWAYISPE